MENNFHITYTYDLPKRFVEDHYGRFNDQPMWEGLTLASVAVETKTSYRITLTDEQASNLLSDAEFYVSMGVSEFGPEYLGLIRSAAATAKRLRTQNVQARGGQL